MRIAIDMDEVMADTLGAQLAWFRDRFGYRWTREECAGKRLEDLAAPEHVAAHHAALHEGSFFGALPVMPGAVEVIGRLAARHEVYVVSAAVQFPGSMLPKVRWLERHFPFIPLPQVVFAGEKSIVDADVLVDDNADRFPRFRGRAILFDAPHNRALAAVRGLTRARSWAEVEALLGEPAAPEGPVRRIG
jgi:5'(3')-deoxyribonucleotidase